MMLKDGLETTKPSGIRNYVVAILLAISVSSLVACSSSTPPTIIPTNELVLPSETPFPIPPTIMPTAIPAIRAADLAQEIPASLAALELPIEREIALLVYEELKILREEQGLVGAPAIIGIGKHSLEQ